ncbi:hypothetical protein F4859DRAFT_517487 [Xylaria cf. heliscus]|nr:hypothetical protein F4859DRAFT_517487 [Xylaria cf. heliscus]
MVGPLPSCLRKLSLKRRKPKRSSSVPTHSTSSSSSPGRPRSIEYEFWQCGHITRLRDGVIISEHGDLSRLPKALFPRSCIYECFGDACPSCYTRRVLRRLRDIRTLLFECNSQHEAARTASRRVAALTEYLARDPSALALVGDPDPGPAFDNYPPEFAAMMDHVVELGTEVHAAAVADFEAAHRRLRSGAAVQFVRRVEAIRGNALMYFETGIQRVPRECMAAVVREADRILREIREYEFEELLLLRDLDARSAVLRRMLDGYFERNRRYYEALKSPEF